MVRCCDGSLYTGVAVDRVRRVAEHNAGRGARYTRGRGPVRLVYAEELPDRPLALRREAAIKRLSRPQKQALIASSKRVIRKRSLETTGRDPAKPGRERARLRRGR